MAVVYDDDDDCELVSALNIHGMAMFVSQTGVVSLPNNETRAQTKQQQQQ